MILHFLPIPSDSISPPPTRPCLILTLFPPLSLCNSDSLNQTHPLVFTSISITHFGPACFQVCTDGSHLLKLILPEQTWAGHFLPPGSTFFIKYNESVGLGNVQDLFQSQRSYISCLIHTAMLTLLSVGCYSAVLYEVFPLI